MTIERDLQDNRAHPQWLLGLALLALVISLAVRLLDLDWLPGELYGDIAIIHDYVAMILAGNWPAYFVLSAGPLYHYLIVPVVWIFGLNFLALKLASVLVSLGVLVAIYLLARELANAEVAVLAVFIAGVSSWLLIFSRLGNSQILLPLVTALAAYFAARTAQQGSLIAAILCAITSALGLYAYPQTFVLLPVMLVTLIALSWTGTRVRRRHVLAFALASIPCAIPFAAIVMTDPSNFFSGYIGGKLAASTDLLSILSVLLENAVHAALALHVRGDAVFRSNPPYQPHLDFISGGLFLVGVLFWVWSRERRRLSLALWLPLLLLQIPSILVLRFPGEVPSASRTVQVTPMVYILVASGLWWLWNAIRRFRWPARLALVVALLAIVDLNLYRYFSLYADHLPNHNTPFGRLIAGYIDSLSLDTHVYVVGCCWGQWGQPEPKGVLYTHTGPQPIVFVVDDDVTCDWLADLPRPAALIWAPTDRYISGETARCLDPQPAVLHETTRSGPIFQSLLLEAP